MKKWVLIISLLVSGQIFGKDIASFRFAVMADDYRAVHVFKTTVSDTRELEIEVTSATGRPPFYFPNDGEVVTRDFSKRLNKHVFDVLKSHIRALSNAEIETRQSQIVCMMMPGPAQSNNHLSVLRDFDYRTNEFKGEMTLVDGPHGCWIRNAVFPKEVHDRESARSLKSLIKVLTLDHVAEEL